jgi:hypothetical protein
MFAISRIYEALCASPDLITLERPIVFTYLLVAINVLKEKSLINVCFINGKRDHGPINCISDSRVDWTMTCQKCLGFNSDSFPDHRLLLKHRYYWCKS